MTESAATAAPSREVGTPRSPGTVILLALITFGIYGLIWYPRNFGELKAYRGKGVGAIGGLLLLFVMVSPFLLPQYVGELYKEDGREAPVSAATGLWNFVPLVGLILYISKVQGALSRFWESKSG
jgi:Domain of unknown function (DUF4234)